MASQATEKANNMWKLGTTESIHMSASVCFYQGHFFCVAGGDIPIPY
jgi:hypothetical protein